MEAPVLDTSRLSLRIPGREDVALYRHFFGDAAASEFYGGPLSPAAAWQRLARDIGHWALRGHGIWTVTVRATNRAVGQCGIVWPEGWPRSELTWWMLPEARRQGYALEASRAVIDWGYAHGFDPVETHMKDANAAARALVERLGGRCIARETFPDDEARDVFALPLHQDVTQQTRRSS